MWNEGCKEVRWWFGWSGCDGKECVGGGAKRECRGKGGSGRSLEEGVM